MRNGTVKGIAFGALMGAGALWAANSMSKAQRRQFGRVATTTAAKAMKKVNDFMK